MGRLDCGIDIRASVMDSPVASAWIAFGRGQDYSEKGWCRECLE